MVAAGNVMHFADDEGAELMLERSGAWSSIRIVSARRAHFYSSPTAASKLRTYLTTGDSIKVFSAESGRVNAEYISESGKRTIGWLSETDLFSPLPPSL